jgi:glutathione S-transferase
MTTTLYTFWISHFSEKARFSLDYEGVSFEERALLPGPHALTIRKFSPKQKVPVLVHDGEVIQGSGAIIDAIPRLFGASRLQPWLAGSADGGTQQSRTVELEALADSALGRAIQAYGYDALLENKRTVIDAWSYRGPFWGKAFYALAFPSIERVLRKNYCRGPAYVQESREKFLRALDEFDRILANQPYLLGDELTRADITVAALLSPLVRSPEYVMSWLRYPPALEEFVQAQAQRPTWSFVARMYREHRNGAKIPGL